MLSAEGCLRGCFAKDTVAAIVESTSDCLFNVFLSSGCKCSEDEEEFISALCASIALLSLAWLSLRTVTVRLWSVVA